MLVSTAYTQPCTQALGGREKKAWYHLRVHAFNSLYTNIFDALLVIECKNFSLIFGMLFDNVLEKLQNT